MKQRAWLPAIFISMTLAGPALAGENWAGLGAFMEQSEPGESPQLNIFTPCDGSFDDPGVISNGECQVADIRCTPDETRLTVAMSQETLGEWITAQRGFYADLSIGSGKVITFTPREIVFGELNGVWIVRSFAAADALPAEPGDIRIDLGVDTLVVSPATGRNLQEIKTLLDRCAVLK